MADRPLSDSLHPALAPIVARAAPGFAIESVVALGADSDIVDSSHKGTGYGAPLCIEARSGNELKRFVLHTATANPFGHDRRADRAASQLLAFDTFGSIEGHVRALDVGAYTTEGQSLSLQSAGEFYLVTEFVEGKPYAEDLRAIEKRGHCVARDRSRLARLVARLAQIHGERHDDAIAWRRAVRDLFGSGEGLFGIIDDYPDATPGLSAERLAAIERLALDHRSRLRSRADRLRRIHGDFHPFNIVFAESDEPVLLDASRGCLGDPADDVVCLSINYLFFGLLAPAPARPAFAELWRECYRAYFAARADTELLNVAPPYFAWRALVLCSPRWYPDVPAAQRTRLVDFVETTLRHGRLDPELAARTLLEAA